MDEKRVILSDKREIFLHDEEDILISIISNDNILNTVEVPYPSGGYGGGMLLLSPLEQYLLFSYYSGESEEAYTIFKINENSLEFIYESGYRCGEGASYIFSDNEEYLFQALPKSVGPWYMEEARQDEHGMLFLEFGEINRLNMKNENIDSYRIRVVPPAYWDEDMAEGAPLQLTNTEDGSLLHMITPWGEETFSLPHNNMIVFKPNIMNTPTLRTERLILRKFTENDLEFLYKIYSDREVNKFLPWFPLNSMEEAKTFYEKQFVSKYNQKRAYHYAICLKEDNYPIGYIGVSINDSYDFGYGLCKEFWHKGIVTEAGRAVIEQLKKDGIPYITATHDVNNPKSGEVMKRLGMKYQYSYEEQWQPKDFLVTFRMYQRNLDGNDSRIYKKYWNDSTNHFVETI